MVLFVNDLVLREPWRLPHFVAVVGPLLAGAASAAMRLAASRSVDVEELLTRPDRRDSTSTRARRPSPASAC